MANYKEEARGALAEFIATMFFVFFGVGSVCAHVRSGAKSPTDYSLSFGFAITALAYAVGDVSGGHMNPAVTVSLAVTGNITPTRAAMYLVAQFLGGILGGGILCGACGGYGVKGKETGYVSGIGINGPGPYQIDQGQAFCFEFFGTLILLFTVYCVAVWSSKPLETHLQMNLQGALAPIPIGMSVMVAHLTLGPFTGCGINPARALGAAVWEEQFWDGDAGKWFYVYFLGPLLASIVAPALYWGLYGTVKPGQTLLQQQGGGRAMSTAKVQVAQ